MEQRVVLTKFCKEGQTFSLLDLNKDVTVSQTSPVDNAQSSQQHVRESPAEVIAVLEVTTPTKHEKDKPNSLPKESPDLFQRTNQTTQSSNIICQAEVATSQLPELNSTSLVPGGNTSVEQQNQNCNVTITTELSESLNTQGASQDEETNDMADENEHNLDISYSGPFTRRMAVCNDSDNAEPERRRMRVFKKRF